MTMPVFEERQPVALLIGLAVLAVALGLAPLAIAPESPEVLIAAGALAATLVLVLAGFRRLTIIVTGTELRFGFPLLGKRLPLRIIEVGDILPIPFWYGWGIHFVRGMWVWNARLGRGLLITAGRRKFLLGTAQAERLQSVLREQTRQAADA